MHEVPILLEHCAGRASALFGSVLPEWILAWCLAIVGIYVTFGAQALAARFRPSPEKARPTTRTRVTPRVFLVALAVVFALCAQAGYLTDALGYWWADRYVFKGVVLPPLAGATAFMVFLQWRDRPLDRLFDAENRAEDAVTEQERMAHAIARAYTHLVEGSPDNLVVYDRGEVLADGTLKDAGVLLALSEGACQTLGYARDALHGMRLVDILHPDDLARTLRAVASGARGEHVSNFDCRYRAGDLHPFPGSWLTLRWSRPRGVPTAVRGVPTERVEVSSFRDVTAEIASDKKREARHAAAVAQAAMEAAQGALSQSFGGDDE